MYTSAASTRMIAEAGTTMNTHHHRFSQPLKPFCRGARALAGRFFAAACLFDRCERVGVVSTGNLSSSLATDGTVPGTERAQTRDDIKHRTAQEIAQIFSRDGQYGTHSIPLLFSEPLRWR